MSTWSAKIRSIGNYLLGNDPRFLHTGNHNSYGNPHPQYLSKWDGSFSPYQASITGSPYIKFATISISKKTWIVNYKYQFEFETLLWASNKPSKMILDIRVDLASNGSYTIDGMLRSANADTYYPVQQSQMGYVPSTNTATDLVLDLYMFINKSGSQLTYKLLSAKNLYPTGNTWYGIFKHSAWRGVKLYDDTQPIAFDNTTAGFVKFDRQVAFSSGIATTDTYTKRLNGNAIGIGDIEGWIYTNGTDLWQPTGVVGQDGNKVIYASHDYTAGIVDWTLSASEKTRKYLKPTNSSGAANIIVPTEDREYRVVNKLAYAVTIKKSGGVGVVIAAGKVATVFYDSATGDVVRITADI